MQEDSVLRLLLHRRLLSSLRNCVLDVVSVSRLVNYCFFFISNENFIKKQKTANPSTLGMYYGGLNQKPRLQRSSKTGREEQEK